ncbi:hypothetical protein TNCV_4824771 [Trichonephila clavipes]|nr:hypothetical protein TNCV_4824771 [Trichonephila clavipes]
MQNRTSKSASSLITPLGPSPSECNESHWNEKVSNHGSIPITIDCNVCGFVVFKEGFHQPIKRTKQSVDVDVTVFDIHLWIGFTPNAAVLFLDVAIQPEECASSLNKIRL